MQSAIKAFQWCPVGAAPSLRFSKAGTTQEAASRRGRRSDRGDRRKVSALPSLAVAALLTAAAVAQAEQQSDSRELSGMAVIGNRELPKALYIVPWKSAELGEALPGPSSGLFSEAPGPLDPDVFRRELDYYDAIQAAN